MVLPSAAAPLTCSAARVPPPPATLVTTMVLPVIWLKYLAIMRALKSVSPPGLAITTTWMGRVGHLTSSAKEAAQETRAPIPTMAERSEARMVFFIGILRWDEGRSR